ncbi:hypothetical protein EVG20_g10835, partial [Dentipellis fragilis]
MTRTDVLLPKPQHPPAAARPEALLQLLEHAAHAAAIVARRLHERHDDPELQPLAEVHVEPEPEELREQCVQVARGPRVQVRVARRVV